MIHLRVQRHVEHTVGLKGDQRLDVVGRGHSGQVGEARELAGVLTHFVGAKGEHANQIQVRALDDRLDRLAGDVTRGPLDD